MLRGISPALARGRLRAAGRGSRESVEGVLVGGCLESMQHLRGTPYWPSLDGPILFLETSEEEPNQERVDGILMNYENTGAYEQLRGLLFGRPYSYAPDEREQLHAVILERTEGYDFPVVADIEFGHTSPVFTLLVDCRAAIDAGPERFEIIEPAVV